MKSRVRPDADDSRAGTLSETVKEYVRTLRYFIASKSWFVQELLKRFGLRIVRLDEELKDVEEDFRSVSLASMDFTMTTTHSMYSLYQAVEYIVKSGIPGDFVECGVWKGGSCMLMASTLLRLGDTSRKIYMYDTFTGMSEPTEEDVVIVDGTSAESIWKTTQEEGLNRWCYSSLDEVRRNVLSTGYPPENIVFAEGKVEESIPGTLPGDVALLRLDTDFYQSTLHELVHLYPLLVNRGVLIIDDYGYWKGCKQAVDEFFSEKNISMLLSRVDLTTRTGVKYDDSNPARYARYPKVR